MPDERKSVFISVGNPHRQQYESLIVHLMELLEAHGLRPRVIDRTDPNVGRPLDNITNVMSECHGAIIIAFERKFFSRGIEKRGSAVEYPLANVSLTTPWSQVETAMAHQRKLPILMLVEEGMHLEALVDEGFDWFLQYFSKDEDPLGKPAVQNRIAQWAKHVRDHDPTSAWPTPQVSETLTVSQLFSVLSLKSLSQVIAIGAAIFGAGLWIGRFFPAK